MSYIVKNCPSICFGKLCSKPFLSYALNCKDCTDCVIKQVIEECKRGINYSQCNCGAIGNLVNILQLFDIEEINK